MRDFQLPRFRCAPRCGHCCKISPITVFPHEVLILKKLAKKFDKKVVFRPGYRIVDLIHRVKIVISYVMELDEETGACPFLTDDYKCLIHDLYKPITCRSFPRVPKVLQYILDRERKMLLFTYEIGISKACPEVKRLYTDEIINLLVSDPELGRKAMPQEYEACMEFLHVRKLYLDILTMLWRSGYVELSEDIGYPWPLVNAYDFIRQFYPEVTISLFTGGKKILL